MKQFENALIHKDVKRVKVLYLDLDGTVRKGFDELGKFVNGPDDVELFPHMDARLLSYRQQGWRIVGVSNQGGIATGQVTRENVKAAVMRTQKLSGNAFDRIMICQHHPDSFDPEYRNCFCRKPKMGMLVMACQSLSAEHQDEMYPPHLALMVGDRPEDQKCAETAGVEFIWAAEWRQLPITLEIAHTQGERQ